MEEQGDVFIEPCEETTEGIVGGDAVGQFQEFFKSEDFGTAEHSYLSPRVGAADEAIQSNQEHDVEAVSGVVPGVLDAV